MKYLQSASVFRLIEGHSCSLCEIMSHTTRPKVRGGKGVSMVSVAVCSSHSLSVHFLLNESHHHVDTTYWVFRWSGLFPTHD